MIRRTVPLAQIRRAARELLAEGEDIQTVISTLQRAHPAVAPRDIDRAAYGAAHGAPNEHR
jgi:hypothetical protein